MTKALDQGGVHVICTPLDYSENQRVLVEELEAHQRAKRAAEGTL